jgi:hypothetical protein
MTDKWENKNAFISEGITGSNPIKGLVDNLTNDFTGILASKPLGKYVSGARCIIKINGKIAGFAYAVSWRIATMQDEILCIDDPFPFELAPKRISVDGTIGMFHIPGKGPSQELIQSNVLSFLFHKYITIEVRDRTTDALLFQTNKAVVTSRLENIRAEQLADITLEWRAIGWQDEKEPKVPKGVK